MNVLDWKQYNNIGEMMYLKEVEYKGMKYINIFKLLKENILNTNFVIDDFVIDGKTININNLSKCFHHYYFANHKWRCSELVKAIMGDFINIDEYNTDIDHIFTRDNYRYESDILSDLSSGDVVLFITDYDVEEFAYTHAAIYLTDKLFLSKFGNTILCITSLDEIHRLYETCAIYRLHKL